MVEASPQPAVQMKGAPFCVNTYNVLHSLQKYECTCGTRMPDHDMNCGLDNI